MLGLSYEDLGVGIAKAWGLPLGIQRCMGKPTGAPPLQAPPDSGERIRWIALASNEIADVLLHGDPKDVEARIASSHPQVRAGHGQQRQGRAGRHREARQKLIELALAMEIRVAPGSAAAKLLRCPMRQ